MIKKLINSLSPSHIVSTLRISQAFLGFITTLLIVKSVNAEEQGIYYAFVNLASSYVFFDLGLSNLLVQVFSRIKNKKDDFVINIFLVRKYFLKMSFLFCALLIPIGFFYFNSKLNGLPSLFWIQAWICLIFTIALSMSINPIFSIVESMDKIKESYSVRIAGLLIGTLMSWSFIYSHHFLYAPMAVPLALSIIGYFWAFKKYPFVFKFKPKSIKNREVFLSKEFYAAYIKSIPTYISSSLFLFAPPLISFYFNGPENSGKLSLSLVFINMISIIATSSIISKIPLLTHLISIDKLDTGKKIFFKEFKKAIYLNIFGYFLFVIILYVYKESSYTCRFLKVEELILLSLVNLINQLIFLIQIYYRANNQEPLAKNYFFSTIGGYFLAIFFGRYFGNMGIILSIFLTYVFFSAPLIYKFWKKII